MKQIKKIVGEIKPKQTAVILGALIIVGVLVVSQLIQPRRSVEAYCQAFKEENAKLPKSSNPSDRKWNAAGLVSSSSDPANFAKAFERLERVAPDDIKPDIKTLRQTFEKIEDDPSQLLTAGLGGLSAESNIEQWNKIHCSSR